MDGSDRCRRRDSDSAPLYIPPVPRLDNGYKLFEAGLLNGPVYSGNLRMCPLT